jgi:hypothetical protein
LVLGHNPKKTFYGQSCNDVDINSQDTS